MGVWNQNHRSYYRDVSGSSVLASGDNLSAVARDLVALAAKYSIVIQTITVNVITDDAAQLIFLDSNSVIIAKTKISPGVGPIVFDFGDEGRQLTEGKSFQMKNSAAGLVADVSWTGYIKPTSTRVPSEI